MKEAILAILLGINGILVGWNAHALWEDNCTKKKLGYRCDKSCGEHK